MNLKNFSKYITFACFVFAILRYVPKYKIDFVETLILLGLISSVFVIIDTITPCVIVDKSKCMNNKKSVVKSKSVKKNK